ncbi:uncharacterized protein LOC135141149 [Zophobas morio]|uniref:uncharacterized protein LOC135141149 n=1 Tax=Zophobas morio TaxID=2755281 RepID=UPI0030836ECC
MVKESSLTWWSESSQIGFELDYPLIMCHAICSDNLSFMPTPCLFCQLDSEGTYEFFNSTFDDSENNTHELIIVPENKDSLQNIFEAISACQPLHPVKEENATLFSQEEHIINHINPFFQVPDTSQIELDALDEEGKYDDAD